MAPPPPPPPLEQQQVDDAGCIIMMTFFNKIKHRDPPPTGWLIAESDYGTVRHNVPFYSHLILSLYFTFEQFAWCCTSTE